MPSPALAIEVKIDGSTSITGDSGSVDLKDGAYVSRVQVDQRLDSPDYFAVTVQMMSQEKFILLDSVKPGQVVEILLGHDNTPSAVCKGEITYLEPSFSTEGHHLTFGGYDFTHRLTRGTTAKAWGGDAKATVKATDVASEVVKKGQARKGNVGHGLKASAKAGTEKVVYLAQVDVNDYTFLRGLGAATEATFDPASNRSEKSVNFKAPDVKATPKLVICREKLEKTDAKYRLGISADFRLSTVKQVGQVEVRGWSPKEKKAILGKVTALTGAVDGDPGHQQAGKAHWGSNTSGPTLTVIDVPVDSESEAKQIAQSIFDSLGMDFLSGDIVVEGAPTVRAGDVVELKQYGTRFSGKYLVEAATHVVVAGAAEPYVTRLHVVRDGAPQP